jgi:protein transport protein SEC61 subunit gamma-like protein
MALQKLKNFITECSRVLRVSRKPTKHEFWTIAKVAGIGILIIGLLGFILHLMDNLTSVLITAAVVIVIILILLFYKKSQ